MPLRPLLPLLLLLATAACRESFRLSVPPQADTNQDVSLASLTVQVLDPSGAPVAGALLGTIPTLNPTGTERGSDGKDRTSVLTRYLTDANGRVRFPARTFSLVQSPLIFNAYRVDGAAASVLRGSTFLDLEVGMDPNPVLTIVLEPVTVSNPSVKVALLDPEPFPRATDFLVREGLRFDPLVLDQARTGTPWSTLLSESNLRAYDALVVGLDASRYADFDQLTQNRAGLIAFVKNNPNKLLFLCQQHVSNFNWAWVADFDVPPEGVGGGFLRGVYTQVAHFDNARLRAAGAAHPLLQGTALAGSADADANGVSDAWEHWEHIEPNKPEVKPRVAWHAGNAATFAASGWDLLVTGPGLTSGDIPVDAGVILAEKRFPNGSRILFCQATYYQASYGPRKAASALLLKDRMVRYLSQWPALRGP